MPAGSIFPVVLGLAVGIGFIITMIILATGLDTPYSGSAFYGSSGIDIVVGRFEPDGADASPQESVDLSSRQVSFVRVLEGASDERSEKYLEPEVITVVIGINNTVVWVNEDDVPHTLATDEDYIDPVSGKFDAREHPEDEGRSFLMPGTTWEFTFTQPGEHTYHGEPHPWIQGTIVVLAADS